MSTTPPPAARRRGRRPSSEGPALDRDRLVRVLLAMARQGGIDALDIRSVASALGVSPRLIYTQVRDKEEMLALLTDEILRDRMPDLTPADWQERLRNIAAAVQSAYRDYPGSAAFILSRSANRLAQPNALLVRDAIFAALAQAGLGEPQQQEVLILFSVITLGNIVVAESLPVDEREMAMARTQVEAAFSRGIDMLIRTIGTIADAI